MNARLADAIDDLSPAWFTAALRAGGVLGPRDTVADAKAALFGTGQFGLVTRAELTYGEENEAASGPASVIVKLPSTDEGSRGLGIAIGAYEGEVRFYQELAPRSSVRVPQAYWTDFEPGTGRVTLVLEDLSADWQVGDAVAGGTVAQVEAAIDAIAQLQVDLWDVPELRKLDWLAAPARTQMLFDGVPQAVAPFLERFGPRLDPTTTTLVERLAPLAASYPERAWVGPLVVAHGDYRLDNLLFQGGSALRATIIDWQSLRLGPPGLDLGILIGAALDTGTRRAHQDALITRWHDALVAGGVHGFSRDDAAASVRAGALWTFLLTVGLATTLAQSDRGDAMWAGMVARSAELVSDLGADAVLI